jgi:hypothetical protein
VTYHYILLNLRIYYNSTIICRDPMHGTRNRIVLLAAVVGLVASGAGPRDALAQDPPRRVRIGVHPSWLDRAALGTDLGAGGYEVTFLGRGASPGEAPSPPVSPPGVRRAPTLPVPAPTAPGPSPASPWDTPSGPRRFPVPVRSEELKGLDLILFQTDAYDYSPDEVKALVKYVAEGGALVIAVGRLELRLDGSPTNRVEEAFGIYFAPGSYVGSAGSTLRWAQHPITRGVSGVAPGSPVSVVARCPRSPRSLTPAPPASSAPPAKPVLAEYRVLRDRAGRDPDAQVRLALWCESRGMVAERATHLKTALEVDPTNQTARGLLSQVADHGTWRSLEDAAARARADEALTRALAEYNTRRLAVRETPDDQWKLGLWCEKNGLAAEARAHITVVTRLAPGRSEAWLKLGCKRYGSRWLSPEAIAAEEAEARAQREADRAWQPRIEALARSYFGPEGEREQWLRSAAEVTGPRAVPAVWRVFARGKVNPRLQEGAVQLLRQIDSPQSTRRVVALALFGKTAETRRSARAVVLARDPRDYVDTLISLLSARTSYRVKTPAGSGRPTELEIQGETFSLRRVFVPEPGAEGRIAQLTQGVVAGVQSYNFAVRLTNEPALALLRDATDEYLGSDKEDWTRWWTEQKGYAYVRPQPPPTRTFVEYVRAPIRGSVGHSCFGAGTLVRTPTGSRPIEDLRVGDQVLSQDLRLGALEFQPVVAVFHNPPNTTVRVRMGDETIVATPIHRFWKAGHGWVMARDLRPGDAIRTLGGRVTVSSVESGTVAPVFNLEISGGKTFFVGKQGALVHDNSLVDPVVRPFDVEMAVSQTD